MKNIVRFAVVVSLLIVSLSATAFASGDVEDRWLDGAGSYERAWALHIEKKVPLVVYFYTDWCPYCHALESQYFPSAPVQDYLRGVIKIRINPEQGRADREVANGYGVRGYPSFFVVNDGTSTKLNPFRRSGANWTPAQFADACRQVGPISSSLQTPKPTGIRPQPQIFNDAAPQAPKASFNEASLPAMDSVFTKYVEATGGATAQGRVTSRVIKGRIDVAGRSFGGKFEVYAKPGTKWLTIIDAEPMGLVKQGFDGRKGWIQGSDADAPELAVLSIADLYRETTLGNMYARPKLLGKVKEGYRDVYIVEATQRNGSAETLYFDAQSGLLLHRDFMRQTAGGPVRSNLYFGDWRNVDGVLLPFRLTQSVANRMFVITVDEIKHNVPVDDAVFRDRR